MRLDQSCIPGRRCPFRQPAFLKNRYGPRITLIYWHMREKEIFPLIYDYKYPVTMKNKIYHEKQLAITIFVKTGRTLVWVDRKRKNVLGRYELS